jgi:hypothetical protein
LKVREATPRAFAVLADAADGAQFLVTADDQPAVRSATPLCRFHDAEHRCRSAAVVSRNPSRIHRCKSLTPSAGSYGPYDLAQVMVVVLVLESLSPLAAFAVP